MFPQILHVPFSRKKLAKTTSGYLRLHCWQRISWRMWPSVRTQNPGLTGREPCQRADFVWHIIMGPDLSVLNGTGLYYLQSANFCGTYTYHTLSVRDFGEDQTWCNDFMKHTWKLTWHAGNSQCSRGNIHLHSWWILHCYLRFRGVWKCPEFLFSKCVHFKGW